ncbi:MAG: metal-dependent membrane protease [Bacteroidetes bacterium]|nr:MAG: metal-dependent membrane protease [Bacteroidota bacterium]
MSDDMKEPVSFWKQTTPGFRLWLLFLMHVLLMVIVMALAQTPSLSWISGEAGKGWPLWLTRLSQAWVTALLFALPVMALAHLSPAESTAMRITTKRPQLLLLLLSVLMVLTAAPGDDWVYAINRALLPPEVIKAESEGMDGVVELLAMPGPMDLFFNLLVMGFVTAVCEELFYRGAVQRLIFQWSKKLHFAVWITAALFAFMHYNLSAFIPRCLLGALLGYLCVWGGSLWLSIAAHFANNAFFLVYYYWSQRSEAVASFGFPPWLGPLSIGLTITLLLVVRRRYEKGLETDTGASQ